MWYSKTAINAAHLCPKMLKNELMEFNRINGYFPKVFIIHLSPKFEDEILKEINEVSNDLNISIEQAVERKEIVI